MTYSISECIDLFDDEHCRGTVVMMDKLKCALMDITNTPDDECLELYNEYESWHRARRMLVDAVNQARARADLPPVPLGVQAHSWKWFLDERDKAKASRAQRAAAVAFGSGALVLTSEEVDTLRGVMTGLAILDDQRSRTYTVNETYRSSFRSLARRVASVLGADPGLRPADDDE